MNGNDSTWEKTSVIAIILSVLSIACIGAFSIQYYIEKQLNFTYENIFVLIFAGALFLVVCIFTIYFSILIRHMMTTLNQNQDKLESISDIVKDYKKQISTLSTDLSEVEDNVLTEIRETQNLIMKLEQEIGVVKCDETVTPIEQKSGCLEIH